MDLFIKNLHLLMKKDLKNCNYLDKTNNFQSSFNFQKFIKNDNSFRNFNLEKHIIRKNFIIKDAFNFHQTSKFYKNTNFKYQNKFDTKSNINQNKNSKSINRVVYSKYENSIKIALEGKFIKKKIIDKEKNFFNFLQMIVKMKLLKILIMMMILYLIIFKIRLFRYSLSRIFYSISSEPHSILYELYFGSNLNIYVKNIVDYLINDEEIQKEGCRYIIEVLEEDSFIKSIADFTNHLLVIILSEERLLETFFNKLLKILQSERLEKETKKFLYEFVRREEIKNYLISMMGYFLRRKESDEAIKQFIEYGIKDILFDHDLGPNLSTLSVEFVISNFIRRRFLDKYRKHFMNDYPDEKKFNRVMEIIKEEDFVYSNNFKTIKKEDNQDMKVEDPNNDELDFIKNIKLNKFKTHKEKFENLYLYNNSYVDGYLNEENPVGIRDKVIELAEIYKNILYTDLELHPEIGTLVNYGMFFDSDYYKMILDKEIFRKKVFMDIHNNDNTLLNNYINDKNLQNAYDKSIKYNEFICGPQKKKLEDYTLNFDTNFKKFILENKYGHYNFKENFYKKFDYKNLNKVKYYSSYERAIRKFSHKNSLNGNIKADNEIRRYPISDDIIISEIENMNKKI